MLVDTAMPTPPITAPAAAAFRDFDDLLAQICIFYRLAIAH